MNKILLAVALLLIALAGAGGYFLRGSNNTDTLSSGASEITGTAKKSSGKTADYSSKDLALFPKEILKDKSISVLDLSNNKLTGAIPAEIHDLVNLEELNLSNNQMTGIPAEVGQLKNLKILNYANNKITGLPLELGNLTHLQTLDLSGNNISQQDLAQIKYKLLNTQIIL